MTGSSTDSYIRIQMRRANRNLLVVNGIILLALLVIAWISRVYYFNFFVGPFRTDDAGILDAAADPGDGGLIRYVSLDDHPLIPTGFTEVVTIDQKPHTRTPYFLTAVGDQFLLVMAERGADGRHLVGPLYRVPADVEQKVVGGVVQRQPALSGRVLPIMLNTTAAFTVAGYIGLALALPPALLCLFNLARGLLRMGNPAMHPIARDRDAAEAINDEIATGPVEPYGRVLLTRSWLLRPTAFGLVRLRLTDAAWVYGVVAGGRHCAVIRRRDRKTTVVQVKAKMLPALLQAIVHRVPWVLTGYDRERDVTWRRRPADVIAQTDARRREHTKRGEPDR